MAFESSTMTPFYLEKFSVRKGIFLCLSDVFSAV